MAKNTSIQWCDSTANPVMGCCGGCELWPNNAALKLRMINALLLIFPNALRAEIAAVVEDAMGTHFPSHLWREQNTVTDKIVTRLLTGSSANPKKVWNRVLKEFKDSFKCYAGRLHLVRGGNKGYSPSFELVTLFPGRMKVMAKATDLSGTSRPDKPWLSGASRLIFISDMGDSLSGETSFEFLFTEIIENASSRDGRRHIWQWLTKRPARMAEFSRWLSAQGAYWPDNLIAMTSVTSVSTCARIDALRRVEAPFKALSVEPLWAQIAPDLSGIDWCIVGGESGASAKPFDLAWARAIREQCRESGTAFFVKQLGAAPIDGGQPLLLQDSHGGDWSEWPDDLKIRSFPERFYTGPTHFDESASLQPILPNNELSIPLATSS